MDGRRAALLTAGAAAAYVAGVLLIDPFVDRSIGCPVHELTGGYCPGCGSTRAVWLLLHGDIAGALRHNALLLPAVAYLVLRWCHLAFPDATRRFPGWLRSPTTTPAPALIGLAALVVAFTVARNLPAFEVLAPPDLG